jgi:GDP-L-fucose synthase
MNRENLIYVAGHTGMVGSSIVRRLLDIGHPPERILLKSHKELDLINQANVLDFFQTYQPDEVYLAAANVGGIHANQHYPADFIYNNIMIEANVIHSAFVTGTKKLLFLGSSCIYPKFAPQPIKESALLTGPLETTNEPYAVAKIAGIKLCESFNRQYGISHDLDYRSIMPTNLYGPGDNYHPENSHVVPALLRRFHEAKQSRNPTVTIWGTGTPRREFLYVDDLAEASVYLMNLQKSVYDLKITPFLSHINVGSSSDISIGNLAELIKKIVNYDGKIVFDHSKPDGTPRKLMDSALIGELGWNPKVDLEDGLQRAYEDFLRFNISEA